MSRENAVRVAEKNPGTKIQWEQSGNKLTFGEDDLSIRCDTRQRDWPVQVDICADGDGNLVIGAGVGRYYVAQVDIPPTAYIEAGDGEDMERIARPIDMSQVVLTLWGLDDLKANK